MRTPHEPAEKRILIVDDSAFEQRLLLILLGELPYRLSVAHNGTQAYELALAGAPDLILLDVRMPHMDGYAVCRLLQANPRTRDIPVIFLSGADTAEERIMGLSVGAVDYVTKPFAPGELLARIRIHLGLTRRAAAPRPAAAAQDEEQAVFVDAVKRLILDNLATLPDLDEIARSVGTYREKLTPMFRARTGMTVFAFIRAARIGRAMELLEYTEIEVQDVALLVGYNNPANFATAFRARAGAAPRAYRQARRRAAADQNL
ncbi:response regulator [Janthinobacterium sp.]|uniref:response regulator transcription factor n=1 Tax=Janthinobacterium sp. TaxID=1871054 RepID=UPI00293D7F18|nr:response regulator [Janthinobacterium sp.]